jgi:hypothetical protein
MKFLSIYISLINSSLDQVKPSGSSNIRHLFLLFFGCLLTTFFIIGMIITYNRVVNRQSSTNTNFRSNFHNFLQSIGLNNLTNRTGLNFFSISNNNNNHSSTHHHHHHRQGESSRTHLNENQDEALLFDDPYTDGGISGGIHGSSANPYKSLTLSVT